MYERERQNRQTESETDRLREKPGYLLKVFNTVQIYKRISMRKSKRRRERKKKRMTYLEREM